VLFAAIQRVLRDEVQDGVDVLQADFFEPTEKQLKMAKRVIYM
jgi:hypothetical protein